MSAPMSTAVVRLTRKYAESEYLFGKDKIYYIPEYQRDYSWGKDEIDDFIQSICHCISGTSEEEKETFMGTVQFSYQKNGTLHVIDGHQRLTTFRLFFYFLELKCRYLGETISSSIQSQMAMNYINRGSSEEALSCLYGSYSDIPNVNLRKEPSEKNIYLKNLDFLKYFAEESLPLNTLEQIHAIQEAVLKHIYFVQLVTKDLPLPQIITIFNTINQTGLDLNSADLFKLQYFDFLNRRQPDECWMTKINGVFESVKNSGWKIEYYIKVYKCVIVAKYHLKRDLFFRGNESFFGLIFNAASPVPEDAEILQFTQFDSLIKLTREFKEALDEPAPEMIANLQEKTDFFAVDLIEQTRYSSYWTIPFACAYFQSKTLPKTETFVKALHISGVISKYLTISSVNYRRSINAVQTYLCETVLPGIAKDLTGLEKDILSKMARNPNDMGNPSNKEAQVWFQENIEKDLIDNYKQARIVCTISALLDEAEATDFADNQNLKSLRNKLFKNVDGTFDLEHILAKNRFEQGDSEFVSLCNGIGNLVILESEINRSVKDRKIREKINGTGNKRAKTYRNSEFVAVKKIIRTFEKEGKWDGTQIENRMQEQSHRLQQYLGLLP